MEKILPSDLVNKGVIGLPDTPGLDTTQMQQKFDEIALDVIIPHYNDLVDDVTEALDEKADLSEVPTKTSDLTNDSGFITSVDVNAVSNIVVGETTITASGEDTVELIAGENVTLTPDDINKTITIDVTGGSGSGDMQASVYDPDGDVATAGGIVAYIDDTITAALTASY